MLRYCLSSIEVKESNYEKVLHNPNPSESFCVFDNLMIFRMVSRWFLCLTCLRQSHIILPALWSPWSNDPNLGGWPFFFFLFSAVTGNEFHKYTWQNKEVKSVSYFIQNMPLAWTIYQCNIWKGVIFSAKIFHFLEGYYVSVKDYTVVRLSKGWNYLQDLYS